MTYNAFGGMLNLTQLNHQGEKLKVKVICVQVVNAIKAEA